jgi:hypothetical protein
VEKLIILSVVLVSFAIPVWASTAPRPRRALRRIQWATFLFLFAWAYMCLKWYPALVELK